MTFYEQRVRHLLRLFADNKASEDEIREMLSLLRQTEGGKELEFFMKGLPHEPDNYNAGLPVEWENIWESIQRSAIRPVTAVRKMNWLRVAAVIVVFIGVSAYFFNTRAKNEMVKIQPVLELKNDVSPGGNKAILTLANGSQIVLDSASNGILTQQGNTEVIKLTNGQLLYKRAGELANEELYNTMITPRGGQYRLILPDGSKVWLNAVSSIRFPTSFTGKERTVEITGEAYFEIEKNLSHPFRVVVNPRSDEGSMTVEVLGTHFNINAYRDEPAIKTTLLEGSLKVSKGTSRTIIKPGQQTLLNSSGIITVKHDADMTEAVAWKDGRFEFKDADLKSIMRQVMRWYDVETEYQGNVPDRYFTADISRNKTLSGVLQILKLSDIDFKLEGKKLTVTH